MPCSVTLPAGSGKTELIAATAAETARTSGSTLVLTHTHAGVDALRQRMRKFGLANSDVLVRTIDSWAFDLIVHFPALAGLVVPPAPDWDQSKKYHRAAARAVRTEAVQRMLKVSYTRVFVDEYQDCLIDQHELILAIAEAVPVAVFGDPLQSLFHFKDNVPVDWGQDVIPRFPAVEVPHWPHRWEPNHLELGRWLVWIRMKLINEQPIDLRSAPVTWVRRADALSYLAPCYGAGREQGSVAVLGHLRPDCVSAAKGLGGQFGVMEAMDEKVTMELAQKIDGRQGGVVASAVLDFALKSSVKLAGHVPVANRKKLAAGESFTTKKPERKTAYAALLQMRSDPTVVSVYAALRCLGELPGVTVHCREAWDEMTRSLEVAMTDGCTVVEALHRTRQSARARGRRPRSRVVSRPLLVKGLEYDHVIILDPSKYTAQELYVALTRGSKSVTVLSDSPVLAPAKMAGAATQQ